MYLLLPFLKQHTKEKQYEARVAPRPASRAEAIADEVMALLQTNGAAPYSGGSVSQATHAVQCAMLAMEALSDLPVIIGALLHNIGCLPEAGQPYGTADCTQAGADYLRRKGFSERVCAIAEQQIAGKRYLLLKDKNYWCALAPANLQDLYRCGGAMTPEEAASFEKQPYFLDIVAVCRWDAGAKNNQEALLPPAFFRRLLWDHLSLRMV